MSIDGLESSRVMESSRVRPTHLTKPDKPTTKKAKSQPGSSTPVGRKTCPNGSTARTVMPIKIKPKKTSATHGHHYPRGGIKVDIDFDQIKLGLQLFKESIGLVKDVKDALPESPKKEAATKSLIAAEDAIRIAEANIAKAFGYPLCHCSFPPGIMLLVASASYKDRYRCPNCNKEYHLEGKRSGNRYLVEAPMREGVTSE